MSYVWSKPIWVNVAKPSGSITNIKLFVNNTETSTVVRGSTVKLMIVYWIETPGVYRVCYSIDNGRKKCWEYSEHAEAPHVYSVTDTWVEDREPGTHTIIAELNNEALTNPLDIKQLTYNVTGAYTPPKEGEEEEGGGAQLPQIPNVGKALTVAAGLAAAVTSIIYLVKRRKK